MGNSASALPTSLTEDELKSLCGDEYEQILFDGLKNDDGTVYSTDFMRMASSHEEREVLRLFCTFFPGGIMNDIGFLTLCRETKLLNKGLFPAKDAEKMFAKIKRDEGNHTARGITFKTWRFAALPDIASCRGMTLETLLQKLSRYDGLIAQVNQERTAQQVVHVQIEQEKDVLEGTDSKHGLAVLFSDVQKNAVVKIQTQARKKDAVKKRHKLAEIRSASTNHLEIDRVVVPEGEQSEAAVKKKFSRYCPRGEMTVEVLLAMLTDAHILDSNLSKFDVQFIFDKSKARAGSRNSPYKEGVILGKRLTYGPFRALTIPELAEMKGVSVAKLIQVLATEIS